MPSVKTAVSFPVDLLAQVDALAERAGESRSAVIRQALESYIAQRIAEDERRKIREAYALPLTPDEEEWLKQLRRRSRSVVLEQTSW